MELEKYALCELGGRTIFRLFRDDLPSAPRANSILHSEFKYPLSIYHVYYLSSHIQHSTPFWFIKNCLLYLKKNENWIGKKKEKKKSRRRLVETEKGKRGGFEIKWNVINIFSIGNVIPD